MVTVSDMPETAPRLLIALIREKSTSSHGMSGDGFSASLASGPVHTIDGE